MENKVIPLPILGEKSIEFDYFPTRMQAFIFKNWDIVPKERIAKVLGCSVEDAEKQAYKMGLSPQGDVSKWLSVGYISIIKVNWQLLPYDQLLELLNWSEDRLAWILKEEDFLKFKLGDVKIPCERIEYHELSEEEEKKTEKIKKAISENFTTVPDEKEAFDFFSATEKAVSKTCETKDKTVVTSSWGVKDLTDNEAVSEMVKRFKNKFLKNWNIALDGCESFIELSLFDEEKSEEYHEVEISDSKITIKAADSAGILRALNLLEDMAISNGAPCFEKGFCKKTACFKTRFIYSFCGLYNDALDVDSEIWLPDELLESYSKTAINGVWIQAITYRLTEFPFEPSLSKGWEQRLANLNKLIKRCAAYGIKIILYINEPRAMYPVVFEKYPHLMGSERKGLVCLCTSQKEVQNYLSESIETICKNAKGLGGFFIISASENLTNCHSRAGENSKDCPVCYARERWEVIAEVNQIIEGAIHRADPSMKVICWDWGWNRPGFFDKREDVKKLVEAIPNDAIVMCNRECGINLDIDGVKVKVDDYSLAVPGVSDTTKEIWQWAKDSGHETCAKLQINNTWECSTIPYVPVFSTVENIIDTMKSHGVSHIMLSWTLGGYPSPNIKIISEKFFETEGNLTGEKDIYDLVYGNDAENVKKAGKIFGDALSRYPFDFEGVYRGPANSGAANPLYAEPSGMKATMTGYAYDDLDTWRTIFSVDIYENRFRQMSEKWAEGLKLLSDIADTELKDMAEAVYIQLASGYNQIHFVRARNKGDTKTMLEIAKQEIEFAAKLHRLMQLHPTIGFEAANHYYYTKNMLKEKVLNCQHIIDKLS
ncbi:MAG: hypothetical protein II998_06805 [Clostridia bacterium]|nr:hypothetical protein [Clostridia bacterium]